MPTDQPLNRPSPLALADLAPTERAELLWDLPGPSIWSVVDMVRYRHDLLPEAHGAGLRRAATVALLLCGAVSLVGLGAFVCVWAILFSTVGLPSVPSAVFGALVAVGCSYGWYRVGLSCDLELAQKARQEAAGHVSTEACS